MVFLSSCHLSARIPALLDSSSLGLCCSADHFYIAYDLVYLLPKLSRLTPKVGHVCCRYQGPEHIPYSHGEANVNTSAPAVQASLRTCEARAVLSMPGVKFKTTPVRVFFPSFSHCRYFFCLELDAS